MKDEVVSWNREVNEGYQLLPGDEFVIGRSKFSVSLMKVEAKKVIEDRKKVVCRYLQVYNTS